MTEDVLERLPAGSLDLVAERLQSLKGLFPEVFHEDEVDFEALQRVLGRHVSTGKERFGLSWPGKAECLRAVQAPSAGTLRPLREASVDFDATEHVIIEGDNFEVLKVLQKSYYGKVKLIYIDPPYNTGNEFIYPDNFREGIKDYLLFSGQVGTDSHKLGANVESDGRFHSKWLNMMYPRLFLARNLLKEDGVIFISIDDHEVHNLRALMNHLYGEENYIATFVWSGGRKNDSRYVSVSHEYVVAYARSLGRLNERAIAWRERKAGIEDIYREHERLSQLHGPDTALVQAGLKAWFKQLPADHPAKAHSHYSCVDSRGVYFPDNASWPGGGGPTYAVLHPVTQKPCTVPSRGWIYAKPERMQQAVADDRIHFGETEAAVPCLKSYLRDREHQVPYSVIYQDGRAATKRLRSLFDGRDVFDHPKDEHVIKRLIELVTDKHDLVLDFFAGSGTTAHAVMDLNRADGGKRKFLLVQLPEPIETPGYATIADITRERVRRAGAQHIAANAPGDYGFQAYRLDSSNFKAWQDPQGGVDALVHALQLFASSLEDGRGAEDILVELRLKAGIELATPVEKLALGSHTVYAMADGSLLVCLELSLSLALIERMLARNPAQIICLEAGFAGNDALKISVLERLKAYNQGRASAVALRVV